MADGQIRQGIAGMGQAVLSAASLSTISSYATTTNERGTLRVEFIGMDGTDNSMLLYAYAVAFENTGGAVTLGTPSALWSLTLGGSSLGAPTIAIATSGGSVQANVTPANTRTQRWVARIGVLSTEEAYT